MAIVVPTEAYCQLSDITRYLPQRTISATSKPTTTDAEAIIKEVAAEINAVLSSLEIGVPVTTADALPVLKRYNAMGAAEEIEASTGAGINSQNGVEFVTVWGPKYKDWIKDVKEGKFVLPGMTETESQAGSMQDSLASGGDYDEAIFKTDDTY